MATCIFKFIEKLFALLFMIFFLPTAKNISFLAPNILHLQHATKSDAGEYKCVISCEPDTITYTCKVVVFCKFSRAVGRMVYSFDNLHICTF